MDPEKLDFGVLARARVQFSLSQIYSDCDQLGDQMGLKLIRVGSSETRKSATVGFRKHGKKRYKTHPNICSNMLQKEGPQKCFFCYFLGPHPSMVSRACPGRLPGPKALQNGAPDMDFQLFEDLTFTFFGDTLEIFRVFHEQRIDSTQC